MCALHVKCVKAKGKVRASSSNSWSSPARVHVVLANAASEEAFASVAAGRAVVFARGSVSTNGTQAACAQVACAVHVSVLGRRRVWHKKKDHKAELFNIQQLNVSAPQWNSQCAKRCLCFTNCPADLIRDGVFEPIKTQRHERLRPEWLTQTQQSITDVVLITFEEAITGGSALTQPHCHHSGPINYTACHDTCVRTGKEKKKKKKT